MQNNTQQATIYLKHTLKFYFTGLATDENRFSLLGVFT